MSVRASVRARKVRPAFLHTMWTESRTIADARHRFVRGGPPANPGGQAVPTQR
ncbi:hypothetical protein GCM10027271_54180 [Saccharopolyspora gloriosae]|uniref:Uncharacterized protein n=1 Tax=Saccharopolyspora gloriosae TaxID=455344 RepID=A0A840N9D2_9PSEU|nr:hypothetical protein [Saccharopolyspora gloriosae]